MPSSKTYNHPLRVGGKEKLKGNVPYMLCMVKWLKMHVLWHVTQCILVHIYHCWRGTYWLRFRMTPNVEEASSTERFIFFYQTTRYHFPGDNIMLIAVRTVLALFFCQSIGKKKYIILHVSK
jgi:hypothetical protein